MALSMWCMKTQDSKHQSCFCVFISAPMPVVKQSPFSLVPKLGYVRNYAVSMTCFTLLLVCPEVSYSSEHNHFSKHCTGAGTN